MAVIVLFFTAALASQESQSGAKSEYTKQAIEYLIKKVGSSQFTFIRNGEKHSSEEAVEHIRLKYGYFKSRIKSPEDFIRLCATKSILSGEPYMVITPQGKVTVASWLLQILSEYRTALGLPNH